MLTFGPDYAAVGPTVGVSSKSRERKPHYLVVLVVVIVTTSRRPEFLLFPRHVLSSVIVADGGASFSSPVPRIYREFVT